MSQRSSELLDFYSKHRLDDQLEFYTRRQWQLEHATGQGLVVSAALLAFAATASALAATALGPARVWLALAIVLPAMSLALVAYLALYGFEQQSKIYGDAARAVQAASRTRRGPARGRVWGPSDENIADLVTWVEDVLRQEHAQWGQLTSEIDISDSANE
jgi:hypothetical protein